MDGIILDLSRAALMAIQAKSTAGISLNDLPKCPIGVLAPLIITTSLNLLSPVIDLILQIDI